MVSKPKRKHSFETEWLVGYARTYPPSEAVFTFSPEVLLAEKVWLIDIRHGLRNGRVIYVDKLEGPGAVWVVHAEDCDGLPFEMTLHVETNSYHVEVIGVKRWSQKNGGANAA